MTPSVASVLEAGSEPSGLVAALILLQNQIPVRIIGHYKISQHGNGIWPRTFSVFHFLRAHEAYQRAMLTLAIRESKPGTLEPTKSYFWSSCSDPIPSIPYSNGKILG